jgi:hypothetical protein
MIRFERVRRSVARTQTAVHAVGLLSLIALSACGTEGGSSDTKSVGKSPDTPSQTTNPGQPSTSPPPGEMQARGVGSTPANEATSGAVTLAPGAAEPGGAPSVTQPSVTQPSGMQPAETPPVPPAPGVFVENSGSGCQIPALPGFNQLPAIAALPDPFLSLSGARISSKAEWTCRRAEIAAQVQQYELGPKPPKPSIVTAAFSDNQLTITTGEPNKTVDFTVEITRPASAAAGPIPLVIELGGSSLDPVFSARGIASINFNNGAMGAQGNMQGGPDTRGQGTFYNLYGSTHEAGSMIAWAWGVSRIIDAIEATPAANIDPRRIAVTGCSRNGKGALVIGAFDERVRLTVPQESGAGGSASWRISQAQHDALPVATRDDPNLTTQTVATAQGEQPWFRANFGQFATANVAKLPHDHHELMGMVAPRPLFVIDNTDMNWLGNESSFTDSVAAAELWNGLGLQGTMGASQVGGHPHCNTVPQAQLDELGRFVDKFLVGTGMADTNVLRSDRILPDRARWIPWSTPVLQ